MDNRFLKLLLFFLAWIGAAALVLGFVALIFGLALPPLAAVSPLVLFLIVPTSARSARTVRRRQALAISTYIEQAVRLNLPIPRMLDAAQHDESRKLAARLRDLRDLLEAGAPLDLALADSVPEMPPRDVGLIGAALRIGRLPDTLARLVADARRAVATPDTTTPAFFAAYPIMMTAVLGSTLFMLAIFVFPRFHVIFRDFHIPLPPLTVALLTFIAQAGPLLLVLAAIVTLAFLGRAIWEVFRPLGSGVRPDIKIGHYLLATLPPTRFAIRNRDLADVFQLIADATESALPLTDALDEAARLYTARPLRRSFRQWAYLIRSGQAPTVADAARSAGFPPLVVGLLASAQNSTNLPDTWRFLARYYRAKFSRSLVLLRAAAVPAMVILFAIPVLLICLSLFLPLVSLVNIVFAQPHFHP